MHFVMGGAVNGRAFYGTPPAIANNGPDDVGQGRLLPTTCRSINMRATLASWFGVGDRPDVDRAAQHQQLQSEHLELRLRLSGSRVGHLPQLQATVPVPTFDILSREGREGREGAGAGELSARSRRSQFLADAGIVGGG